MGGIQSAVTSTRPSFDLLGYSHGLEELILMYWWVIVLANLVLFAFAKHSLKCWELRQDRRRLQCCYMRHCQRLHAARKLNSGTTDLSHNAQAEGAAASTRTTPTTSSPSSKELTETGTATNFTVDSISKREKTQLSHPLCAPIVLKADEDIPPPKVADLTAEAVLRGSRNEPHGATAAVQTNDSHPPSLLLKVHSDTSDLSLSSSLPSTAQPTHSATKWLLNRFGLMSSGVSQDSDDRFDICRHRNSSDRLSRLSHCCPRYSEDEQRLIDKKRQENVHAWMEAKRALVLTESLAAGSCGVTPLSSVSRCTMPPCEKEAMETELLS
ncbi:hypothetical protein Q4I28_000027 [Leishmania naiffi]|uniref:Uncharacterized protein n=1 Tax=Leishmania naiffi TaxID=5678 RepID=A0AAW3CDS1_9TRYP